MDSEGDFVGISKSDVDSSYMKFVSVSECTIIPFELSPICVLKPFSVCISKPFFICVLKPLFCICVLKRFEFAC